MLSLPVADKVTLPRMLAYDTASRGWQLRMMIEAS